MADANSGGGATVFALVSPQTELDAAPTSTDGAAGIAGTAGGCAAAQNGAAGRVIVTFP